jgi:hypothetical protein
MRISIVGNAPLACNCSDEIDRSDFVVRFNMCRNYGERGGTRLDALVFTNTGKTGRRFATDAILAKISGFAAAGEIWLTRNRAIYHARRRRYFLLHLSRRLANTDFSDRIIEKMGSREIVIFGADLQNALDARLRELGAAAGTMPSAGMLAVEYVLRKRGGAGADVVLYGFSHQGIKEHPWESERRLIEAYISEGKLRRGDGNDASSQVMVRAA